MDPRRWSVARQALGLVVVAVVVVVLAAVAAAYLQTRDTVTEATEEEVLAVAQSIAASPTVETALVTKDPAAGLQPYAERVRKATGADFVTVMTPEGIRWTHPTPSLIGRPFLGHTGPALRGKAFTETYTGTLGPSVRAVAPVQDSSGQVVALVAVGITVDNIGAAARRQLPPILLAGLAAVVAGAAGAWLLSRRLRRQTHGLGQAELTRMYEFYDGVLHAVREGVIVLDTNARLQLVNDEARRLLGLGDAEAGDADVVGRPVDELELPPALGAALRRGGRQVDELQLTADRVLVVSQSPATWDGRPLGSVVTLRDHTDLVALSDELGSARSLAESLRSQAHEAANRLHSVIGMIELGETDRALEFATAELADVQELTDRVIGDGRDPVIAALLLGKAAEAAERGVQLGFPAALDVPDGAVPARDLLTIVGNLIDNALDATLTGSGARRVAVAAGVAADELRITVANSGPPVPDPERIFERGWSTNGRGRGLGLALVQQAVQRNGGTIGVHSEPAGDGRAETVFEVRLPLARVPG